MLNKELKTNERVVVTNATSEFIANFEIAMNSITEMECIYLANLLGSDVESEFEKCLDTLTKLTRDYLYSSLINNDCKSI